jgi:short-subunit dehydrogenase
VRQLASQKVRLILSARNENDLRRVQRENGLSDNSCLILPLDLSDSSSMGKIAAEAIDRFGEVDILINNGGVSQRSFARDTPLELDRKIMEVNYFGTVALTKSILPHMIRRRSGQIVVISSVSGKFGFYLRSAYAASKHALHGFFETLRMELHKDNISVLIVCPGRIATAISQHALTASGEANNRSDANQRIGMDVNECAARILQGISKGKEEIFVGKPKEHMALLMKRFFPSLFSRLIRNQKAE